MPQNNFEIKLMTRPTGSFVYIERFLPVFWTQRSFTLILNPTRTVCITVMPSKGSLAFVLQSPEGAGPPLV